MDHGILSCIAIRVNKSLMHWSADGRHILFSENGPETSDDVWALTTQDRKATRFPGTPFNEMPTSLSPDGRWIAYRTNETGRNEIYIQSFPASGRKWQISLNGGSRPLWRPDGQELF